ncbi:hypothetical protein BDV59DRAFT_197023 [Aspergillus ambiguus]|uniref:putative glucokinase regulator family protein n=1 Tax=Aspergillus ambiguus TaxID=176160 RepID=UPI003CCE2805
MDLHTLGNLQTEAVNARTANIDQIPTIDLCRVINAEDHRVAASVTPFLPQIAEAIDALAGRVRRGGRVVYVGAGTSGRLGILDASEIPPTFAAPPSQFIGLIAGGDAAIRRAQEGAEDSMSQGEADLTALDLDPKLDSVIGIAASGRTPYVLGCMAFAKRIGCLTIGVACASPSAMSRSGDVDIMLCPLPGPEVVTGSTRLKAGTATKLVLNMLSTGTMIRIGKTYGNLMVDLVASNEKLKQRSRNILRRLSDRCRSIDDEKLDVLLGECGGSVKLALLAAETGLSAESCQRKLDSADGVLSKALETMTQPSHGKVSVERRYVLCIDGGATKSAAVIVDGHGVVVGRGRAGACNVTDGQDIEEAVGTLACAAQNAMNDGGIEGSSIRNCFLAVWIGLAGIDRGQFRESLTPKLCDTFGVSVKNLRLTNDVDLLAGAMIQHREARSAIVVIAGTGSVAMRYEWDAKRNQPRRLARSGGWGHLLGDEGGGYAIGLQALKSTMTAVEELRLGVRSLPLEPFHQAVLEALVCAGSDAGNIDLVGEILVRHRQDNIKSRIASLAEVVLNLAPRDAIAKEIVQEQARHLADTTVGRLLHPSCSGYAPPESTGIIFSGSLLAHRGYYASVFLDRLIKRYAFAYVHPIIDAAAMGAHSLLAKTKLEVNQQ